MQRISRRGKVFVRSFTLLFILLLVLTGAFSVIYLRTLISTRDERERAERKMDAERIAGAFDQNLLDCLAISDRLAATGWVIKLSTSADTFERELNPMSLASYCEDLGNYVAFNGLISLLAVAVPGRDMVLSTVGRFEEQEFLNYAARRYGQSADELTECIATHTTAQSFLDRSPAPDQNGAYLLLTCSLDKLKTPRATLIMLLSRHRLEERLCMLLGEHVASVRLERVPDGARVLGVEQRDGATDEVSVTSGALPVVYRVSYADAPPMAYYALTGVLLICGALLFSALAAYAMACVVGKPLQKLIQTLRGTGRLVESERDESELEAIARSFHKIYSENRSLNERLDAYLGAARANALTRLLRGRFGGDVGETLNSYGIAFTDQMRYSVLLISTRGAGNAEDSVGLLAALTRALSEKGYTFELIEALDVDIVAIIAFAHSAPTHAALDEFALYAEDAVFRDTGVPVRLEVGEILPGYIGISKSYQQLKAESSARSPATDFYYPLDWEAQLTDCLKRRDADGASRIIDELRLENEQRGLDDATFRRLITRASGTLTRVAEEASLDSACYALDAHTRDGAWERVSAALNALLRDLPGDGGIAEDPDSEIVKYVNAHFLESSICLTELGEQFGLSVSAASKAFKSASGVNFLDYVTARRMEYAKKLLASKTYTVEYIADAVGYQNEYSFRRAFARSEHMRPKEYADQFCTEEIIGK